MVVGLCGPIKMTRIYKNWLPALCGFAMDQNLVRSFVPSENWQHLPGADRRHPHLCAGISNPRSSERKVARIFGYPNLRKQKPWTWGLWNAGRWEAKLLSLVNYEVLKKNPWISCTETFWKPLCFTIVWLLMIVVGDDDPHNWHNVCQ